MILLIRIFIKYSILGLLLVFYLFNNNHLIAQQSKHKLEPYTNQKGDLYWPKSQPIYIFIADNPEGNNNIKLKSKGTPKYANPFYFDTEGINFIRTRHAVDPTTRTIVQPRLEVLFEIYADGKPPISTLEFKNTESYTNKDTIYYGKKLDMHINVIDYQSGIKNTYYALNDTIFKIYDKNIAINEQGIYNLKYYSVDNVGNSEKVLSQVFVVDASAPKTYYNISGAEIKDSIISEKSKISLLVNDDLVGVKKTYFKIDDRQLVEYNGKNINISQLEDGYHTINYYSIDKLDNTEQIQSFSFYLDKTAPIVSSDILGDKFTVDNKVYFSGRTKLNLIAIDNKAGVKNILYAFDKGDYQLFTDPIYLPDLQGEHIIHFYATDNVGNRNKEEQENLKHSTNRIYVDLNGPSLSSLFKGKTFKVRDTTYINSQTELILKGHDKESGLKNIKYLLNTNQEEILYTGALKFEEKGFYQLNYFGYDNVNNRNIGKTYFVVDNQGPEIFIHFSSLPFSSTENNRNIYSSALKVYLAATDAQTGTNKIFYSINGGPQKNYAGVISGFLPEKDYKLKVFAEDNLDNKHSKDIEFKIEK